jgi:micrococcal nuclease
MKLRRYGKSFVNLIPLIAIGSLGLFTWQKHQSLEIFTLYKQLPQTKEYRVTRVSDGDTIVLDNGDKVRFCGIDAPEIQHGKQPGQPLGEESKANLQKLIDAAGGTVLVMENDRDHYGRIVGEVFVKVPGSQEEKYLNAEQILSGNAYLYKQYSSSCLNEPVLITAEEKAKAKKQGVWNGTYERPWDFRKQQRER